MKNNSLEHKRYGVFFDLDGVLVDSPQAHADAWAAIFRPYGIELPAIRLHREEGKKSLDIAQSIVEEFDLKIDERKLKELIERKREIYRENAPSGMREDARSAVNRLKMDGWTIGLVSGSVLKNEKSALSREELNLFDVILTAESYTRSKPDPEPYLKAAETVGIPAKHCIAVENAPLGISSARFAGMKVVAITTTLPESELFEADKVVDDLTELPHILKSLLTKR